MCVLFLLVLLDVTKSNAHQIVVEQHYEYTRIANRRDRDMAVIILKWKVPINTARIVLEP